MYTFSREAKASRVFTYGQKVPGFPTSKVPGRFKFIPWTGEPRDVAVLVRPNDVDELKSSFDLFATGITLVAYLRQDEKLEELPSLFSASAREGYWAVLDRFFECPHLLRALELIEAPMSYGEAEVLYNATETRWSKDPRWPSVRPDICDYYVDWMGGHLSACPICFSAFAEKRKHKAYRVLERHCPSRPQIVEEYQAGHSRYSSRHAGDCPVCSKIIDLEEGAYIRKQLPGLIRFLQGVTIPKGVRELKLRDDDDVWLLEIKIPDRGRDTCLVEVEIGSTKFSLKGISYWLEIQSPDGHILAPAQQVLEIHAREKVSFYHAPLPPWKLNLSLEKPQEKKTEAPQGKVSAVPRQTDAVASQ